MTFAGISLCIFYNSFFNAVMLNTFFEGLDLVMTLIGGHNDDIIHMKGRSGKSAVMTCKSDDKEPSSLLSNHSSLVEFLIDEMAIKTSF